MVNEIFEILPSSNLRTRPDISHFLFHSRSWQFFFIKLTHNSVPQLMFVSSCHFMSRRMPLLGIVYSSASLVIGAGADMSLGGDSNVTTRYRSRLTITGLLQSLTLCSPLAGVVVSSDQVCSGHTE